MNRTRWACAAIGALGVLAGSGGAHAGEDGRIVLDAAAFLAEPVAPRGRAVHVAAPIPLAARVSDHAQAGVRPDGAVVWTMRIESPGAVFMSAKFSRFILPAGVEVGFIARDGVYEAGPFTSRDVKATGRFGTPMIPGDELTIEVVIAPGGGAPELTLESVSHGFRDVLGMGRFFEPAGGEQGRDAGRGGPFACQRDIVCPEGAPYLHLKDAAAEGYDGAFVCSGQLVNNAREDGRYLYITAAHCEWWRDPSTMAYYWDYANETCGGDDYPAFTFSLGSTDLYHSTNPDYDVNLLELDGDDLEGDYDVYFAGWNRGAGSPLSTVAISHPADKPLQVAIDDDPTADCASGGCPGGWGPWYWRIDDYEVGVTEGGSSGGGLYDQDLLLVGVLTGGVGTNCGNFGWDEYFKLNTEWDELRPFLDPDDTGALTAPGWDGSGTGCAADLAEPFGQLDFSDVLAFLTQFASHEPGADLAGPFGVWDFSDVLAFLVLFGGGCP